MGHRTQNCLGQVSELAAAPRRRLPEFADFPNSHPKLLARYIPGWFSALPVPVYFLTSIARYDLPDLPAFEPGQTTFPPLATVQVYAKQCDFCDAVILASSALAGTSLARIQFLPMQYFHTHGVRMLRRSPSKI